MSNAAVTPAMRMRGWNVHLLASPDAYCFGGLYQHHEAQLLTFRDVVDELRLSFDVPAVPAEDSWQGIAFALDKRNRNSAEQLPLFVTNEDLDIIVPSLPCPDPQQRALTRYHVVRHGQCSLPKNSPLEKHLEASCAVHIARPQRRYNAQYLAPKRTSDDPRVATMPFRRKSKLHTSSSSPKRKSGSASPNKDQDDGQDIEDIIVPENQEIDRSAAQKVMDSFRAAVLTFAKQCAVTGKGQSWCSNPAVGPSLQACHIVPQQQFHLYPDSSDVDIDTTKFSGRRLLQAWHSTWSATNGMLMMSHIHELFDARLFSIHPETHVIRAFVPYDVILDYHNTKADIPDNVDRAALRHHYHMCCIENMVATMPPVELTTSLASRATSGTNSPFSARSDLPATPGPNSEAGDPSKSKRQRTSHDHSTAHGGSAPGHDNSNSDARHGKRRCVKGVSMEDQEWIQDDWFEGHVTPNNSRRFLADVNFELGKLEVLL